jgi:hypothetical protein
MSSGLFAMNKKVTSLSWVAPWSISNPGQIAVLTQSCPVPSSQPGAI